MKFCIFTLQFIASFKEHFLAKNHPPTLLNIGVTSSLVFLIFRQNLVFNFSIKYTPMPPEKKELIDNSRNPIIYQMGL